MQTSTDKSHGGNIRATDDHSRVFRRAIRTVDGIIIDRDGFIVMAWL